MVWFHALSNKVKIKAPCVATNYSMVKPSRVTLHIIGGNSFRIFLDRNCSEFLEFPSTANTPKTCHVPSYRIQDPSLPSPKSRKSSSVAQVFSRQSYSAKTSGHCLLPSETLLGSSSAPQCYDLQPSAWHASMAI